jgi:hypothetical protein
MTDAVHNHGGPSGATAGLSGGMSDIFTQAEEQIKGSAAYQQMALSDGGIDASESQQLTQQFLGLVEQMKGSPLTGEEMRAAIEFCQDCFAVTVGGALGDNGLAPAPGLTATDVLANSSGLAGFTNLFNPALLDRELV